MAGSKQRYRDKDGAGKSESSWLKHDLLRQIVGAHVAVLMRSTGGRGVIVDMHAGDGEGVPLTCAKVVDPRQMSFDLGERVFDHPSISEATPALACRFARDCFEQPDVILCETVPDRREHLRDAYGSMARIFPSHRLLLREDLTRYSWAMVMNDPNGPAKHGLDVMQYISNSVKRSDFAIVVNESALERLAGLDQDADDDGANAHMIRGAREAAGKYEWMRNPEEWARRLGKKYAVPALTATRGQAFRGRVILVSNYIADGVRSRFWNRSEGGSDT